jgi:hypothetical protein
MIDNPTICDMIMYSTLMCFHLSMPVLSAIFHVGNDQISKHVMWNKTFVQNIDDE